MKITKLLKIQKELDQAIEKKHNVKASEIVNQKIIALYVEVGEFTNEVANFKYWKSNKNISKDKVLEEYVDCLHFYLTLFIFKNVKEEINEPSKIEDDFDKMTLDLYQSITKMHKNLNQKTLHESFEIFLAIGKNLDFSWNEVEKHYLLKNKVNFERLKNNY